MGVRRGELEVLLPLGDGGEEVPVAAVGSTTGRGPRRRWPLVVVAAVAVAAVVGVPLRQHLAARELTSLGRHWSLTIADDVERSSAEQRLKMYFLYSDTESEVAFVNGAVAALYREERRRLDAIGADVHGAVLIDHRNVVIRADLAAAVAHRAALLAAVAEYYDHPSTPSPPPNADDRTAADGLLIDHDLAAARAHWKQRAPTPTGPSRPYAAEAAAQVRLRHWLDQPTGAVLVVRSADAIARLDVDASRLTTFASRGDPSGNLVMRQGYLVYGANGDVWAVAPDGSGPPRPLGHAASYFAADDPTALWLVAGTAFTATEVDGMGRVLKGPVPSSGIPIAATAGALIENPVSAAGEPAGMLQVWDVAAKRVACQFGPPGLISNELATRGNLLAWSDPSAVVHVTDVTTCRDVLTHTFAVAPVSTPTFAFAAFSPDRRTLALASTVAVPQAAVSATLLLDLASGDATAVPTNTPFPLQSLAWTSDGTRLFWMYIGGPSSQSTWISTWHLGDPEPRTLRARDLSLIPPLLVVP
ncbi:MAG: hypothetical protein QOK39_657 [Acidimicrobiaceae bacterium]|nr:hypothetical protein [Acidimicrobiaceae bacterium]